MICVDINFYRCLIWSLTCMLSILFRRTFTQTAWAKDTSKYVSSTRSYIKTLTITRFDVTTRESQIPWSVCPSNYKPAKRVSFSFHSFFNFIWRHCWLVGNLESFTIWVTCDGKWMHENNGCANLSHPIFWIRSKVAIPNLMKHRITENSFAFKPSEAACALFVLWNRPPDKSKESVNSNANIASEANAPRMTATSFYFITLASMDTRRPFFV